MRHDSAREARRYPTKRGLISGVTGQDGSYLAEHLVSESYRIFGLVRRKSTINYQRLESILGGLEIIRADLLDRNSLMQTTEKAEMDEIYSLAARSFVPTSWDQPVLTGEFTALGACWKACAA